MIDSNANGQQVTALSVSAKFTVNSEPSFLTAHADADQVDVDKSKVNSKNTYRPVIS